jgi:2-methylaconitate cis-trans-isomerase PrpF
VARFNNDRNMEQLRVKVCHLIGWTQYTRATIGETALPFAVSVTGPADYPGMFGSAVRQRDVDLVARFYVGAFLHTAAPGAGSTTLAAAASIPGTVPNRVLPAGDLRDGKGGTFTYGHPSGTFTLTARPVLGASPDDTRFAEVSFPRTARIICDGTIYIKNQTHPDVAAWKEADARTAHSFFLEADSVIVHR